MHPSHPLHCPAPQAVPAALTGKENAVAEDGRVLAAAGLALEESCRQLERLRRQKAAAEGGAPKDTSGARLGVAACRGRGAAAWACMVPDCQLTC